MRVCFLVFMGLILGAGSGLAGCAANGDGLATIQDSDASNQSPDVLNPESDASNQDLHASNQDLHASNQDLHASVLVSDRNPAGPPQKLIIRPEGCYLKYYVPSLVKVDTRGEHVAKDVFIAKKTVLQDDYYSLKPADCPYERAAPEQLIVYNSKLGFDR